MADQAPYNPITIMNLERITDDVIQIGRNCVLRMNVGLKKTVNGQPYFFHKEYEYSSLKGHGTSLSIKRSYDYYLSIENYVKPEGCEKAFIRLNFKEFDLFKKALDICISWFTSTKFKKLFIKGSDNKLSMTNPIPSHKININTMNKWINFEPIIYDLFNGTQEPAIRMYLSDSDNFTDITIDTLFGMKDMLSTFNMFLCGQNMIPKIEIQLGTNRTYLDNKDYLEGTTNKQSYQPKSNGVIGRKPGSNKSMNDLDK